MNPSIRRQTLFDALHRSAARTPHKLAIACGDTRWTYAEFERISERDQPTRPSQHAAAAGGDTAVEFKT